MPRLIAVLALLTLTGCLPATVATTTLFVWESGGKQVFFKVIDEILEEEPCSTECQPCDQ